MTTRIYLVSDGENIEKLVRATNRAQAIRHVTKQIFDARVAGQFDLVRLLENDTPIETAAEESADE
jgi:hypothetical protein